MATFGAGDYVKKRLNVLFQFYKQLINNALYPKAFYSYPRRRTLLKGYQG